MGAISTGKSTDGELIPSFPSSTMPSSSSNCVTVFLLVLFVIVSLTTTSADGFVLMKRDPVIAERVLSTSPGISSSISSTGGDDYPEYQLGVKYDEYPMVVPKKKAALLLDRLMVALQHAIDEEDGGNGERRTSGDGKPGSRNRISVRPEETMDLQRRGHGSMSGQQKGRVYWRCYFNAVTCFK